MKLEKDKLYISFHKPRTLLGYLISLRTLGRYSHCELILDDYVYYSNPGGVRKKPFIYKPFMDIYEIKIPFEKEMFLNEFKKLKDKGYDYWAIFLSHLFELGIEHNDKFFCSELCLFLINKFVDDSLTFNLKSVKASEFNPWELFKYLKEMEII